MWHATCFPYRASRSETTIGTLGSRGSRGRRKGGTHIEVGLLTSLPRANILARVPEPRTGPDVTAMSDWSRVTRPIPVPNERTKPFWEAVQGGGERRRLLARDALRRGPPGRARARGGAGRRGRFRPRRVGHRWAGDVSGAAGDGPRGRGRHHHRVGELHDGDAEALESLLA